MFNFGSDDKEELEQNMQEIKGMIQGEQNRQNDQQGFDDFSDFGNPGQEQRNQQDMKNGFNPQDQSQGNNNFGEQQNRNNSNTSNQASQQSANAQGKNNQNFPQSTQQDSFEQEFGAEASTAKPQSQVGEKIKVPGQPSQNQNSQSQGAPATTSQKDIQNQSSQEPEQEKVSKRSVENHSDRQVVSSSQDSRPSADEPLFLREENFVNVREMIEEMGYLAQELQQNLDEMKDTVRKEKEYSRDAREVVEAYSDRREDIEDIIKTGQK